MELNHQNPSFIFSHKFNKDDVLNLESFLTDEEKQIRDIVRSYASSTLFQRVKENVNDSNIQSASKQIFAELGQLGILNKISGSAEDKVPLSSVGFGLIAREIEYIDSGYRTSISAQTCLVMHCIKEYGTIEMKTKYLKGLGSGELIGAFGLTEPDHGSDPRGMESTAILQDDEYYLLNGTKCWITNSPIADILIIWAKEEDGGIGGYVVEKGVEGLSTPRLGGRLAMAYCDVGSIVMEDLKVMKKNRLDSSGWKSVHVCNNKARYGIAWGAIGAAEFCYKAALEYSIKRVQFGRPLAQTQLIQRKLADMITEISIGLISCYHVGRLIDRGDASYEMINMLKRNCCSKALKIGREARDILGANGLLREFHVMRHCANLEAVNTYEGTEDIHALVIGKSVTGFRAF